MNYPQAFTLSTSPDYDPAGNSLDAEAAEYLDAYAKARARVARWLIPNLREGQGVAEASASIKRARQGRVDPVWEGQTHVDMAAEAEVYTFLLGLVQKVLESEETPAP